MANTKTEPRPTLETLHTQRTEVLRRHQRAASLLDHARTQDRATEDVDLEELVAAPEVAARTRHELRTLDVQILRAEREAAAAAEAARAAVLAEGQQVLAAEWPALVREQRRLQQKWRQLHARLDALDHRSGGWPRFGPAAWPGVMGVDGAFDGFVRAVRDGFRLALDE